MNQHIQPSSTINGEITIPSSKSFAQRAIACALLSKEKTTIKNFGFSDDELTALNILLASNKKVIQKDQTLEIDSSSVLSFKKKEISFNEAGLASRLFTPLISLTKKDVILSGSGSLNNRPMDIFDSIFPQLKVFFQSNNGKLPFKIKGPIEPKSITIDGNLSSQFISGLIYAFVGSNKLKDESITLINPTSIPYIELSLEVLKNFGILLKLKNNKIKFNGPYNFKPAKITIEKDWSSASFFIVAAALKGSITFKNMNPNSKQADISIVDVVKEFGANVKWNENSLTVSKNKIGRFSFDATNAPDLFPPLAVLASFGEEESSITGISRLFSKESNRAKTIISELTKLGANIKIDGEKMLIAPAKSPSIYAVNSCNDHRIAMAAAIFGLNLNKPIEISDFEAVNKSFPTFYKLLESVT